MAEVWTDHDRKLIFGRGSYVRMMSPPLAQMSLQKCLLRRDLDVSVSIVDVCAFCGRPGLFSLSRSDCR